MSFRVAIITFIFAVAAVVFAVMTAGDDADALMGAGDGAGGAVFEAGAIDARSLDAITLVRQDADAPYEFESAPDGWRQVEPFPYPMDRFSIEQLAAIAAGLQWSERYPAGDLPERVTLEGLGLDPPRGRLVFRRSAEEPAADSTASETVTIDLGRRGIAGRAYLHVQDRPFIYVVSQELHERALEMDPKEWRDRTIFPLADQSLDRILIDAAGTTTELVRDGRTWRINEPVRSRASAEAVTQLLDAISRASAAGFLLDEPDDLGRFGLNDPAGRIRIEGTRAARSTGQGSDAEAIPFSAELLVGARMGSTTQDRFGIVTGRPTVIRVPQAAIEALFRPTTALVSATGTGAQPADVKRIRIVTDEHDFTLERDLEDWSIIDQPAASLNASAVGTFLETLATVQAGQVVLQEYPRDLEAAVVTLYGYDLNPLDTVRIVRDPSNGAWAFENGDNVLRVMSADLDLPLSPEGFAQPPSP